LWLLTEVVFVSTIVVFVVQFVVPSFIMKDISKLKSKITSILHDFQASSNSLDANNRGFNAAEHLFVSVQLAKLLPHLQVSKVISSFSTPWPRQSYQHGQDIKGSYNRGLSYALSSSVTSILLFLLSGFVSVPLVTQDASVHVLASAAVGYTVLLHTQLFSVFPALAFLPLFVCLVVAHFVVRSVHVKQVAAKITPSGRLSDINDPKRSIDNGRNKHADRRASLQNGLTLLRTARSEVVSESASDVRVTFSDDDSNNESGSSEASDDFKNSDDVHSAEDSSSIGSSVVLSDMSSYSDDDNALKNASMVSSVVLSLDSSDD
jgi:hypothetical protein